MKYLHVLFGTAHVLGARVTACPMQNNSLLARSCQIYWTSIILLQTDIRSNFLRLSLLTFLSPLFSAILEKILASQLIRFLEGNNLLNEFSRNRSITDAN